MRQWHSIIEFKFNRLSQAESGGVSSKRSGLRRLRRGRPRGARRRPRREPTLWRRFAFGWRRLPNRLPLSLSLKLTFKEEGAASLRGLRSRLRGDVGYVLLLSEKKSQTPFRIAFIPTPWASEAAGAQGGEGGTSGRGDEASRERIFRPTCLPATPTSMLRLQDACLRHHGRLPRQHTLLW